MVEGLTASAAHPGADADLGTRRHVASAILRDRSSEETRVRGLAPSDGGRPCDRPRSQRQDPGDPSGEATPVPIPNTVVKLSSAEDTEGAAPREHRPSPGSFRFHPPSELEGRAPSASIPCADGPTTTRWPIMAAWQR